MTPLHHAVIEGDMGKLKDSDFIAQWRDIPDSLGFTPLEIAKLLGKYAAMVLLGGELPTAFRLHPNGIKKPIQFPLAGFEKSLGFHYRPFLTFPSYKQLEEVVNQCPYLLRSPILATDQHKGASLYDAEIWQGKTAPICIKWIDIKWGYGAFAECDIPEGTCIGEYTGVVRRLYRKHPDHNPYCFHYPTKFWSFKYWTVDALHEGNITRFINHSNSPNLTPGCVVDRKLLHIVFLANRLIKQGEQLTFNYGMLKFW